jgi:hypothetical protein
METKSSDGELIVRYLLGELPEEEQARVEDRAFSDREYMQNILAAESDLIDEYVRGELSDAARRQFESRFLASSERRQKVEFARALEQVVSETTTEEAAQLATARAPVSWRDSLSAFLRDLNPAAKLPMAAAALMVVIGVSWLVAETVRLRAQIARLDVEQQTRQHREELLQRQIADERARGGDLAAQLQHEREWRERSEEVTRQLERDQSERGPTKPSSRPAIVSLALWPGIPRSGVDRPQLVVPLAARLVRLRIGLERGDEYKRFRVELRTREGQEVLSQNNLHAQAARAGQAVVLNLLASVLNAGEYELALKGVTDRDEVEDVGYYYFSVRKN